MRIVRGSGGKAAVFTHTDLAKVELVIRDDDGESIVYLTPHRARRLAEHLCDASDRAEGDFEGSPIAINVAELVKGTV
jgi:hypothetical protein